MHTAEYVEKKLPKLKRKYKSLSEVAWRFALLCVGFPYIFGDRGQYCTPSHRRAAYNSHGVKQPTIKSKCKNFNGTGTCTGCQFYPGGKTRAFDCRGFTYWILKTVYGWTLWGGTVTSQWNDKRNWKAKGQIKDMPKDTLCCLFVYKNGKWPHTGLGLNGETIECSSGVQHFTQRNEAHVDPEPEPEPTPEPSRVRPTIKKGSRGDFVKELQTMLIKLGYSVGAKGVDGIFGKATDSAVREFQKAQGLGVDGIVGKNTWAALDKAVS